MKVNNSKKYLPQLSLLSHAESDLLSQQRCTYDLLLRDEARHTTTLNIELNTFWPPIFFFYTVGLLSSSADQIMVSKIDDFDQIYSGYMFRYLVLAPNYLTLPLTFLFVKFMGSLSLQRRMIICGLAITLGIFVIFKVTLFIPDKFFSFCMLFLMYCISFSMQTALLGYSLGMLSFCEKYLTIVFYVGQSSHNVILMSMKLLMNYYKVPLESEAWVIIAWLSTCLLGFLICSYFLGKTNLIEEVEIKSQNNKTDSHLDYKSAFVQVKWILFQVGAVLIPNTIIFPGIVFGLGPVTVMTQRTFVNTSNFIFSIIYILSRPIGMFEFNRMLVKVNIVIGFVLAAFLVYAQIYGLNLQYEGLCYSFMVISAFMMFRGASGVTYLSILSGRVSTDKDKQAIGQLMSASMIGSRGLGNIISIILGKLIDR